jgi:hypothetical protein
VRRTFGQARRWLQAGAALSLLLAACAPSAPTPTPTPPRAAGATATPAATPTRPAPTPTRSAAPAPTATPRSGSRVEATFRFVTRLSTPEEIEELGHVLKETEPCVLDYFGDERSITIGYDASRCTLEQLRERLGAARHPVEP